MVSSLVQDKHLVMPLLMNVRSGVIISQNLPCIMGEWNCQLHSNNWINQLHTLWATSSTVTVYQFVTSNGSNCLVLAKSSKNWRRFCGLAHLPFVEMDGFHILDTTRKTLVKWHFIFAIIILGFFVLPYRSCSQPCMSFLIAYMYTCSRYHN